MKNSYTRKEWKEAHLAVRKRVMKYSDKMEDGVIDLKVVSLPASKDEIFSTVHRLIEEAEYIPYQQQVVVRVGLLTGLKETKNLNEFQDIINKEFVRKIFQITKKMKYLFGVSILSLIFGLVAMVVAFTLQNSTSIWLSLFQGFLSVTSWIFLWTAVEKLVFDYRTLNSGRRDLFMLYEADYTFSPDSVETKKE